MRDNRWRGAVVGALCVVGAVACTGKEPSAGEVGFAPEFECGELDLYDAYVLLLGRRAYEVACGEMPPGTRDGETPWDVLAAQDRDRGSCEDGGAEGAVEWRYFKYNPCALDAMVNAMVHGFRVAGCPEWEYEDYALNPSENYDIAWYPRLNYAVFAVVDSCSGEDPD